MMTEVLKVAANMSHAERLKLVADLTATALVIKTWTCAVRAGRRRVLRAQASTSQNRRNN